MRAHASWLQAARLRPRVARAGPTFVRSGVHGVVAHYSLQGFWPPVVDRAASRAALCFGLLAGGACRSLGLGLGIPRARYVRCVTVLEYRHVCRSAETLMDGGGLCVEEVMEEMVTDMKRVRPRMTTSV